MKNEKQFAIVITHTGARKNLLDMNWLEQDYSVDESDWIVLSKEGWRAVARGEASIWEALQRKLLIGLYISQPGLIAIVGHPLDDDGGGGSTAAAGEHGTERHDVARIVRRVRSILLPATVMGFWTDEDGWLMDVIEPAHWTHAETFTTNVPDEEGEPAT
jgi:hypothetical protein